MSSPTRLPLTQRNPIHHRAAACSGKAGYPNAARARRSIVNMQRARRLRQRKGRTTPKLHVHVYRCSVCGQWHVGHQSENEGSS